MIFFFFSFFKIIKLLLQKFSDSAVESTGHNNSQHPIDCIVYDAFLPWALEVAHQFGIAGAAFFTQACTVNYVYYSVHHRQLTLPVSSFPVSIDGLESFLDQPHDMPSFIGVEGSYPAYFEMVLSQFSNADKADFILVNTVYELEEKVHTHTHTHTRCYVL